MSQENVEVVRAVYERWSEGDLRASVDVFDPKVLLVVPSGFGPDSPEGGTYLGTEAIAASTREALLETWAELTWRRMRSRGRGMRTRERARVRRGTHQRRSDRDALLPALVVSRPQSDPL